MVQGFALHLIQDGQEMPENANPSTEGSIEKEGKGISP